MDRGKVTVDAAAAVKGARRSGRLVGAVAGSWWSMQHPEWVKVGGGGQLSD
jgi:hypothetical protein